MSVLEICRGTKLTYFKRQTHLSPFCTVCKLKESESCNSHVPHLQIITSLYSENCDLYDKECSELEQLRQVNNLYDSLITKLYFVLLEITSQLQKSNWLIFLSHCFPKTGSSSEYCDRFHRSSNPQEILLSTRIPGQ